MERLTEKNNVIQYSGLWRIVLPDDKHPEAVVLPTGHIVHRTKFLDLRDVYKYLNDINEWYRQRGGRPKVADYMPELKVDKRKQNAR